MFFHHFRLLSGFKFELSKFFRPDFQNSLSFVQLTFNWKPFSWYVFTFVQFLQFLAEKTGLQQKLYRKELQNCSFLVEGNFSQNVVSFEKPTNFRSISALSQQNFVFLRIRCSRVVKIALFDVNETLREKIGSLNNLQLRSNFSEIWPKKISTSAKILRHGRQNCLFRVH